MYDFLIAKITIFPAMIIGCFELYIVDGMDIFEEDMLQEGYRKYYHAPIQSRLIIMNSQHTRTNIEYLKNNRKPSLLLSNTTQVYFSTIFWALRKPTFK